MDQTVLNKHNYALELDNGTTLPYSVLDGNSILNITKTASNPQTRIDTYTIAYSDGTSDTFNVTNGFEIEFRITTDQTIVGEDKRVLQYREAKYSTGQENVGWNNLFNLITLRGATGLTGATGIQGYSITSVELTNTSQDGLTKTYTIKNSNNDIVGTFQVVDGKIPELRKNEDHIQ